MPVAPISSFPIPIEVDFDFRPDNYVADWCALAATLQNITGEGRRAEAHGAWLTALEARGSGRGVLTERMRADRLPPADAARWVAGDPLQRVSGEYLPRYLPGEVEIARLVLDTRPMIVYSVRAFALSAQEVQSRDDVRESGTTSPMRGVRIVDEYGTTFTHAFGHGDGTFTLGELIRLIDSVRSSTLPEHPEHVPFPEAMLLEAVGLKVSSGRLHDFVQITSTVYPELRWFYRARLSWWVKQHFAVGPRSRYVRHTWAETLGRWWGEGADG